MRQLDQDYTAYVEQTVASLQAKVRDRHAAADYDTALLAAEKCREIAERHYGPAHPIFASCLNNIALLNKTLGNLELATEQYEKTVQAYVDALGMDNTSTGVALHNLALCIWARRSGATGIEKAMLLEQAKTGFEDAIASHSAVLKAQPDTHKGNLATSQSALASVLREMTKPREAEELLLGALRQMEDTTPPAPAGEPNPQDELTKSTILNNLGYHYRMVNNMQSALVYYNQAWDIRSEILPHSHPDCVATLHNLAELFTELGDEDMANKIREAILKNVGHDGPGSA